MSRIVRPPRPSGGGSSPRSRKADPLTCPDCGAEMRILAFIEEDRVIGRILRHLGLLPDASRGPPLQEPVYEPIYNDLPRRGRGRRCPTSPSERPKSLRRRPVLASWRPDPATRKPKTRPNQREKPKTALTAPRGFCKLRKSWSKVRFPSETKPGRRRSAPGPENQIPIPSIRAFPAPHKSAIRGRHACQASLGVNNGPGK